MSDEKLSELDGDERDQALAYVRQRWTQYYTASRETRKDGANFIAIMNGGGAATVLAFSGAIFANKPDLANAWQMKAAIVIFVLGIIFSALAYVVEWIRLGGLFEQWRRDTDRFYKDEITFDRFYEDDIKRSGQNQVIASFLISLAFGCLPIGAALGALLLLGG